MRSDPECIFCRIVRGEIPSTRVFETDTIVAFRDINPSAPTHILVVPREHIASVGHLVDSDHEIAGSLLLAARDIANAEGIDDTGYRVATNVGAWGGQTVDHLHLHILGGRQLGAMG
jgi:histidine triad (HIT) family protein